MQFSQVSLSRIESFFLKLDVCVLCVYACVPNIALYIVKINVSI